MLADLLWSCSWLDRSVHSLGRHRWQKHVAFAIDRFHQRMEARFDHLQAERQRRQAEVRSAADEGETKGAESSGKKVPTDVKQPRARFSDMTTRYMLAGQTLANKAVGQSMCLAGDFSHRFAPFR